MRKQPSRGENAPRRLSPMKDQHVAGWHRTHSTLKRCFVQSGCAQCLELGCSFCTEGDRRTCFDSSLMVHLQYKQSGVRHGFCRQPLTNESQHGCRGHVATAADECHRVDSLALCKALPCKPSFLGGQRQCCQIDLVDWLRVAGGRFEAASDVTLYPRMDVIMKAVVARGWMTGNNSAVPMYMQYQSSRLSYHKYFTRRAVDIRLQMFKALYDSVQLRGFDWSASPLPVGPDFRLQDGSHRAALALAMRERFVAVARSCDGISPRTRSTTQNMQDIGQRLSPEQLATIKALAWETFSSARHRE